jgi:SAM-dependent methyltransferase
MSSPPRFDRLAGLYRWMELMSFGPWLMRTRMAFLDELAGQRAVVLGDGDGRFTARLLGRLPELKVDAVDASPAMLAELKRRTGPNRARLTTHEADARFWTPADPPYELIVTHFFLDCLTTEEVAGLAAKLRRASADGAVWVVSEFAVPQGVFGALVARPVVSLLYWAFGLLTGLRVRRLPDHATALLQAGFRLKRQKRWLGRLLVSQMWVAAPGLSPPPIR